jgi:hypothetical protein
MTAISNPPPAETVTEPDGLATNARTSEGNTIHIRGSMNGVIAMTMIDSLSTLAILGNKTGFSRAVRLPSFYPLPIITIIIIIR